MDHNYESSQTFKVKVTKRAWTISSRAEHVINFKFFFEFKISRYVLNLSPDSLWLEFMGEDDPTKINISTNLFVQQSLSYEVIRQGVRGVIKSLPLFDNVRQQLIEFAWKEVNEIVSIRPSYCYKVIDLDFQLMVHNRDVSGLEEVFPSVNKYKTDSRKKMAFCSLCSEELSKEAIEAMGLPCEHVFHGDCIDNWLKIGHRCQFLKPRELVESIVEKLKLTNSSILENWI